MDWSKECSDVNYVPFPVLFLLAFPTQTSWYIPCQTQNHTCSRAMFQRALRRGWVGMGARSCRFLPKDWETLQGICWECCISESRNMANFCLNYNHSPILLHSISEELQNLNSEFLQGTSMCKSERKEKMLEHQWKEQHVWFISLPNFFCPPQTTVPFFCPEWLSQF